MGGCTNAKVCVAFHKLAPLASDVSISRTISDFLDYSDQLRSMIAEEDRNSNRLSPKYAILKVDHPFKVLILPTCKFGTGWGTRELTKSELLSM